MDSTRPDAALPPLERIRRTVRTVPNWPAPGVMFRDITPLLADAEVFHLVIEQFVHRYGATPPSRIAALDARGFIIGAALSYALGVGFVPIRKRGKLPFRTVAEPYALEYGQAEVEIHVDAVQPGDRVVLIDDLIATGGTMAAGLRLLQRLGAQVVEGAAIIDLPDLQGSQRLRGAGLPVFTLVSFEGH
jgi:adenine phosphoribosyltransferase